MVLGHRSAAALAEFKWAWVALQLLLVVPWTCVLVKAEVRRAAVVTRCWQVVMVPREARCLRAV